MAAPPAGRSTTFHGYRTRVYSAAFDPPAAGGADTLTQILELKEVGHTGEDIAVVDATHYESPDAYHESIPGFGTGGEISFTVNYTRALYKQLRALAPVPDHMPQLVPAAGADPADPDDAPGYGRRRIFLEDRRGNQLWARVIFKPPTREISAEGAQTIKVVAMVAEGKPRYIEVAGT